MIDGNYVVNKIMNLLYSRILESSHLVYFQLQLPGVHNGILRHMEVIRIYAGHFWASFQSVKTH